jgi:hypothetical protein
MEATPMTYADARYELLNMTVGCTKIVDGSVVTRWSAEKWEIGTLGQTTQVLERALDTMGFFPLRRNDAGAMVAEYQEETGCDWSSALAACNVD